MIKLSAIETKWSSLLPRICALILCISIRIFDFGLQKLLGLSRNRPRPLARFGLGRLEFKSSATLVNSQLVASCQLGFEILLCCI